MQHSKPISNSALQPNHSRNVEKLEKQIITIILLTLTGLTQGQNKVLYHSYSPTASSWDIIEWNVSDTSDNKWLLKETLDSQGRVVELEFLKDGNLIDDPLCYLANRVIFEYNENQIIETLYHSNQQLLATDCEMHYRTIYHLDKNGFISKRRPLLNMILTELKRAKSSNGKRWVPEHTVVVDSLGINFTKSTTITILLPRWTEFIL